MNNSRKKDQEYLRFLSEVALNEASIADIKPYDAPGIDIVNWRGDGPMPNTMKSSDLNSIIDKIFDEGDTDQEIEEIDETSLYEDDGAGMGVSVGEDTGKDEDGFGDFDRGSKEEVSHDTTIEKTDGSGQINITIDANKVPEDKDLDINIELDDDFDMDDDDGLSDADILDGSNSSGGEEKSKPFASLDKYEDEDEAPVEVSLDDHEASETPAEEKKEEKKEDEDEEDKVKIEEGFRYNNKSPLSLLENREEAAVFTLLINEMDSLSDNLDETMKDDESPLPAKKFDIDKVEPSIHDLAATEDEPSPLGGGAGGQADVEINIDPSDLENEPNIEINISDFDDEDHDNM